MIRGTMLVALACGATMVCVVYHLNRSVAQAEPPPIRPIATSAVGPWEIVVWSAGRRVNHCTLVRAAPKVDEPKFGILVDHRGVVLSVDTAAWQLTPKAEVPASLAPASGRQHRVMTRPVSPTRANVAFGIDSPLLDQLQSSDYFDIRIERVTVRVATEDFNTARVVFDICVQKIGADWRAPSAIHDPDQRGVAAMLAWLTLS
jgi:hypothetical protein